MIRGVFWKEIFENIGRISELAEFCFICIGLHNMTIENIANDTKKVKIIPIKVIFYIAISAGKNYNVWYKSLNV